MRILHFCCLLLPLFTVKPLPGSARPLRPFRPLQSPPPLRVFQPPRLFRPPLKASQPPVTFREGDLSFEWDPLEDRASVIHLSDHAVVWEGSLLPGFWLERNHRKEFVKARIAGPATANTPVDGDLRGKSIVSPQSEGSWQWPLLIGNLGHGRLILQKEAWGLRFSSLEIEWTGPSPAILEMYFGADDKGIKESSVHPTWDRPFMPDWQAFGFCVPGAKEGPAQSFFRNWDFGLTNIALGAFGPSMGTPYGAAYPKPLYFTGMGSNQGFIALGAGSIPDAPMSLRVQSARGCFRYTYNEDIWGAPPGRKRVWTDPLRISLGPDALAAFKNYYRSFPAREADPSYKPVSFFNTWGLWREKKYTIKPIADFAKSIGASMVVLDDGWESSQGSGAPNGKRFPALNADLASAHEQGMVHGFWETLGWIDDTTAAGLTSADLIVDKKGRPCMANWNFDPFSHAYYCLDISSAKTREFLKQRTIREMQALKPALIKLDFGYAMPSPDMGVPRNPLYRGERLSVEMIRLIATAAKSVDPSVKIMYYGISPLCVDAVDIVSLDDQGDLWYDIAGGHGEWSVWASLLSDKKVALTGSSGYSWEPDEEVILNTAIIGTPGASLPILQPDGRPVADQYLNRRLAIDTWFRRTILWTPLWLNSRTGNFDGPPRLHCWGRLEKGGAGSGKDSILTALVLRDDRNADPLRDPHLPAISWKGRWALLSQDDRDLFSSSRLAIIPFDPGEIIIPCPEKPAGISRLNLAGESAWDQWEWKDGQLKITVSKEVLGKTAGFLLTRNHP